MYRSAPEREPQTSELVYAAPEGRNAWMYGFMALIPPGLAIVTSVLLSPNWSPEAFVAGAVGLWVWYRRRPTGRSVLVIRDGVLDIRGTKISLVDIADVAIDRPAEERIEHGSEANAAYHAISLRRREIEPRHVLIVRREGPPVTLGTEPILEMHAEHWMGKVRSFLRKSDWIPDSERSLVPSSGPASEAPVSSEP